MDSLKFVGSIISIVNFLIVIVGFAAAYLAFKKITTNHLHHISEDLTEIKSEQQTQKKSIMELKEDVGFLKGFNNAKKDS